MPERLKRSDDGTFDALIYHSESKDEAQTLRYEQTTSEIIWEHRKGIVTQEIPLSRGQTFIESTCDEYNVRVITTVDPPYNDW